MFTSQVDKKHHQHAFLDHADPKCSPIPVQALDRSFTHTPFNKS